LTLSVTLAQLQNVNLHIDILFATVTLIKFTTTANDRCNIVLYLFPGAVVCIAAVVFAYSVDFGDGAMRFLSDKSICRRAGKQVNQHEVTTYDTESHRTTDCFRVCLEYFVIIFYFNICVHTSNNASRYLRMKFWYPRLF